MTEEIKEIPVPLIVKQLIDLHNIRLQEQQAASLRNIQTSCLELMNMIGLRQEDGWRLDIDNLKFVRVDDTEEK